MERSQQTKSRRVEAAQAAVEGATLARDRGQPPKDQRRVLLLTPRLLDSPDGRCTTDLALALDRSAFEPVVCCYAGWGPLAEELVAAGIDIFPFRRRSGLDPTFMPALAAEIRARQIDVVHSLHARKAYVVGALSGVLAGVTRIVGTFRDRPPRSSIGFRTLGRICGELMDAVVATSEEVHQDLLRGRWVPPGKTKVIPDGVNLARFADPGRRQPARALWGIGEDVPLVGAVLRSDRVDERELLARAFDRVRRVLPNARLVVCGLDRDEGDPTNLGRFADSPAFYAAIDVLCIPFARRVVPLSLLEALAAGVPVAASRRQDDYGMAPEGPWAFADITDPGPGALARGMCELILEGESAAALVRGGRLCVREEHAFEPYVAAMELIYAG